MNVEMSPLPLMVAEVDVIPIGVANLLLERYHYLGPIRWGRVVLGHHHEGLLVQVQVWKHPTARMLENADTTLELARWCITPMAPPNAGSWFMARAVTWIKRHCSEVTRLVSYSDPTQHDGALYKACNWQLSPTHHYERFLANGLGYPSRHGSWDGVSVQQPKARWILDV